MEVDNDREGGGRVFGRGGSEDPYPGGVGLIEGEILGENRGRR